MERDVCMMKGMEQTLLICKPDAVQRRLVGEIVARFERKGLRICGMKMMQVGKELAAVHYKEHEGKWFLPSLIGYMTSGTVVAFVVEGKHAVEVCRRLVGATLAAEAEPGTLRGDFALSQRRNLVHASDSTESAAREIALWFTPEEIASLAEADFAHVYDFPDGEPF